MKALQKVKEALTEKLLRLLDYEASEEGEFMGIMAVWRGLWTIVVLRIDGLSDYLSAAMNRYRFKILRDVEYFEDPLLELYGVDRLRNYLLNFDFNLDAWPEDISIYRHIFAHQGYNHF